MQNTFKRGIFDRYDGWRVRKVDPVFRVIPYILRTRNDSQNLFEEYIPIEHIESFIRANRDEIPNLTFMYVIVAALVRLYSQRPHLNRFVVHNKIYARNELVVSFIIKRESGEEIQVKPEFEPTDTLAQVSARMTEAINEALNEKGDTDALLEVFGKMPSFMVRLAVWALRVLDNCGKLPRDIHKMSPWHCSMFITNVGSLGIGPIYHHLYEFGTCSLFVALGKKEKRLTLNENGECEMRRYVGLKFVTDERICDGFCHASSMKLLSRILKNPDVLLNPPDKVYIDDGVLNEKLEIQA